MKKFTLTLLSLGLVAVMSIPALSVSAHEATTKVCHSSYDTADYAGLGYKNNNNGKGPISITKATLNNNGTSEEVYFIGLCGTDFVEGQATGIMTDLVAGFNLNNPYLKALKKAIIEGEAIPVDSKIVLCGHSLGGMVAQQIAADKEIKAKYQILNVVTFGSPLISAGCREGQIKRLGDKNDFIPYLSATGVVLPVWSIGGLNREDGGFGSGVSNGWKAHNQSYGTRNDGSTGNNCWGEYDVLGIKGGNATLSYDVTDVHFYNAPTKW